MITKPRGLFFLYKASDDVLLDVLAIIPISVVWDLVNESGYSIILREFMRCARLLALLRLFALKSVLKKIMVEFDFSPASHLLTNVVVFCIIAANAMACYFYLLADDKDFIDALPVGFDPSMTPITGPECLEQATLYGNCTWFIYDRSIFGIEARFIRSILWSLVLLSTVGYGDILSFTNSECLIGFWWIYLGALICYFTSCAVGSVVTQITVLSAAHDRRVEEITRALVRSDVPAATRMMIRCHYEANWELNGSVQCEEGLMKRLPRSLRHILQLDEVEDCTALNAVITQLSLLGDNTYKPYIAQGTDTATGQNVGFLTRVDPTSTVLRTDARASIPVSNSTCPSASGLADSKSVSKNIYATFAPTGFSRPLTIIGAHFLAQPTNKAHCFEREAQATVIANLAVSQVSAGNHVIISGDINDWSKTFPDCNSNVPISNVLGILERPGFFNVAGLAPKTSRYTQWFDRNKDCVFAATEVSSLDHIIVSSSLRASVTGVAFRNDLYTAACSGFNSDHYPITTTFAAV